MKTEALSFNFSSDDILDNKNCFELEQISKARLRLKKLAEINELEKQARKKQTFDRESHVYLVRGQKQYYRIYREIDMFVGYGNVVYLGIEQEPLEYIRKIKPTNTNPSKFESMPVRLGTLAKNSKFKKGMICCYCEIPLTERTFTREHIIPKRVGGNILMECCYECNNEKGGLMLHSYIQMLCYKDYSDLNQTKIKNANEISKKYNL